MLERCAQYEGYHYDVPALNGPWMITSIILESARELINRRIRLELRTVAAMLIQLRDEGRLCVVDQKQASIEAIPQIICSLGINHEVIK